MSSVTKSIVIGLFIARFALPLSYGGTVAFTHASVLSSFTALFTGQKASAAENEDLGQNSQKMPLLESHPSPIIGTSSITTVTDGTALLSSVPSITPQVQAPLESVQAPDSNKITTYKVQSGDTVSTIAQKFGISVNTILWANNLRKNSTLSMGKNLVILPISGVTYTVQKNDTLQSLALKYKGDVQEIMAYNNMPSDQIKIGDMIVIPDGESTSTEAPKPIVQPKAKSVSLTSKIAHAVGINVANAESSDEDSTVTTPIVSTISSGYYSRPIKAGLRTQGIHGNNAVDLADACGTPIYAAAAGSVIVVEANGGWNGGYGNYVVISHGNGSQTLYAHMSKVMASIGDQIAQGQEIGLIGNTGKVAGVTGCHVHFEIRNGPANPF